MADTNNQDWPLWEVFIQSRKGGDHKHVGSLHAADAAMAIDNARDVYTRRQEGNSIWVVRAQDLYATKAADEGMLFDPADSKIYRHPTFYPIPNGVKNL